jgi:serine/threonine protein kinase
MKEMIGQGAYGIVCSAFDLQSQKLVAIKKIENVFDHRSLAKRTLRELQIVRALVHENILGLERVIRPHSHQFNNIYMVSDLMETDLACVIRSPQELTEEHCQVRTWGASRTWKTARCMHRFGLVLTSLSCFVFLAAQFFIYQVLRGLKYIHSANVIHRSARTAQKPLRILIVNLRCVPVWPHSAAVLFSLVFLLSDLKPRNLLVNSNCDLKVRCTNRARLCGLCLAATLSHPLSLIFSVFCVLFLFCRFATSDWLVWMIRSIEIEQQ